MKLRHHFILDFILSALNLFESHFFEIGQVDFKLLNDGEVFFSNHLNLELVVLISAVRLSKQLLELVLFTLN